MKKSTGDRDMTALVVEAEPVGFGAGNEIPNDSVEALHGLLAAGGPAGSERLVATRLKDISHSPFYNLTVGGEPAEKALVLLYFTQRSAGNLQASGVRLLTDNVLDGSEPSRLQHVDASKYGTIARCTV